jgi:EAL domain-containing protein (putative c-di-GMP-specific phosphodiesterase class I)
MCLGGGGAGGMTVPRPLPTDDKQAQAAAKARPERPTHPAMGRWTQPGDKPVSLIELHEALNDARIHTRYQPVVRLADRVPVGLEVLARLEHPQRGTLGPDLFVPQIEDAGLAFPLTQAVVRRAFAEWGGDRLAKLDLWMALNFPLDVLLFADAMEWMDAQRRAAGIPAARIGIELTESRPVTNVAALGEAVARLRAAGYALAIDDVGPGVRDPRHLLGLGFTVLKLDKGLVLGSRDDPAQAAQIDALVAAAHAAGLGVVAEGIEDAALWARMREAGVEQAQGFLIAQPMPASEVAAWHRAWCQGRDSTPA